VRLLEQRLDSIREDVTLPDGDGPGEAGGSLGARPGEAAPAGGALHGKGH
jgi:hypothetical protein